MLIHYFLKLLVFQCNSIVYFPNIYMISQMLFRLHIVHTFYLTRNIVSQKRKSWIAMQLCDYFFMFKWTYSTSGSISTVVIKHFDFLVPIVFVLFLKCNRIFLIKLIPYLVHLLKSLKNERIFLPIGQ